MPFGMGTKGRVSSSRPMSSKCDMSEMKPSAPECDDEWLEDDLDDFDPLRPGGEPGGASLANEVISSSMLEKEASVSERWRVWTVAGRRTVGLVQWRLM